MYQRKQAIKLTDAEHHCLIALYLDMRIYLDNYKKHPNMLRDLADAFNSQTGRSDSPEDVLHYMTTRRKDRQGMPRRWPRLGELGIKPVAEWSEQATPDEVKDLLAIYVRVARLHQKGSDSFQHDPELCQELETEFQAWTGHFVPGGNLLARIEAERKAGRLPKLDLPKVDAGTGFTDLDEAGNM